jgi:putative ABC transport system permease protein
MLDDLKLAWRRLRHSPGFAVVSIVTLALAVGANTAIFTVADAVLFRPLPYADPDRLYVVRAVDATTAFRASNVPFEYVRAIQEHHSGVAGVALRSTTLFTSQPGPDGAESVETFVAAPDYFQILGVQPVRGRLFQESDVPDGTHTAMLTYESWRRRFGSDESIVGRAVALGPEVRTVIGVLPAGFIFPSASLRRLDAVTGRAEYVTVAAPPQPGSTRRSMIALGGMASDAIVRLKPGVTRERAQAELDALAAGVRATRPNDRHAIVLDDLRALLFPTGRGVLTALLVSAGLVLLVGCANLANMLAARLDRRQQELAIHAALGATRLRLVRPLFLETLAIGIAAGALALVVAALTFDALLREVPPAAYGRAFIDVDARVAWFSLILGIAGGLLFAVIPAWRSAQRDVRAVIRGPHSLPLRQWRASRRSMIAAQIALAIVLAVGAVTAARNLIAVLNAPLGFNPDHVIALDAEPRVKDIAERRQFLERARSVLASHPDVVSVGVGTTTPFYNLLANEGPVAATASLREVQALPGYLETLQVPLREGRLPQPDHSGSDLEPAVVSESAARRLFPDRAAVGEVYTSREGRRFGITAVVGDENGDTDKTGALVYVFPRELRSMGRFAILVRTRTRGAGTLASVRRAVVALVPPNEPVAASWMSDSIGALSTYRNPRFQTIVLGSFGVLALGLAALGVFAAVSAMVAARAREMGIRIAIGATPRALIRQIVREALVPVAAGAVAGVLAARMLGRLARAAIAGFDATNADALAIATFAVLAAGALAAYLPARRAGRVDPIAVLRAE